MTLFHRYNRKKVVGGEEKERLTSGVQSEPTSRGSLAMTVRQPDDVANYKKESIAATKHCGYTPMQQSLAVKKGERDGAAVAAAAADMHPKFSEPNSTEEIHIGPWDFHEVSFP